MKRIKGSKGGGDSRRSVEAPNSLFSIANARIIDLVSEGEIQGFAHGEAGMLRDVYYNETPVENPDGSRNFKFLQIDARYGTQDQSHIPGFAGVENELSIGVELKFGVPWSRSFTNKSLNAVRVRLGVSALVKTNTENGDTSGTSVTYAIDVSTDGGPFVQVLSSSFSGKTTTSYERGHRIELPKSTDSGWMIRVRRLTPDSSTQYLQNKTFVIGVTEIVDGKFRYPMSALVATQIDASQFQSIPTRSFHMLGRIIRVPANYDPETRTYATTGPGTSGGTWDGTFKTAYSNNPAWVFYDLVTHTRYGLGKLLSEHRIDKWSLYAIGQYCDVTVPDGFGGFEPRMTCNLYLQQAADAWKVLGDLTSVFRGICYWAAGSIVPVADRPSDAVYAYTNANVVDGKFTYSSSSRMERYSAVMVSYNDMTDMGRLKTDYYDDQDMMSRFGYRPLSITAIGCTSRGQARRLARWVLLSGKLLTNTVSFAVGMDGTYALPGQIVRVADRHRAGRRMGGRISSGTVTYVTPDAMPNPPPAPGDDITVLLPSGVTQTREVGSVTETSIYPTIPFSSVPTPEGAWTVDSSDLSTQMFRVLSVARGEEGQHSLTCLQHNPTIFGAVDYDAQIIERPISVIPGNTQPPPTNLTVSSVERAGYVVAMVKLTAQWSAAPGAVRYRVQWQKDDSGWSSPFEVHGLSTDMDAPFEGTFLVRVEAVNALGVISVPVVSEPHDVTQQTTPPVVIQEVVSALVEQQEELDQERVDRFEGDAAEAQERAASIAEEALNRANALIAERTAREAAIIAAQGRINDILSDSIISAAEKPQLIIDYETLMTEFAGISVEANASEATTELSEYATVLTNLTLYLNTLTTPTRWDDTSGDTLIL